MRGDREYYVGKRAGILTRVVRDGPAEKVTYEQKLRL